LYSLNDPDAMVFYGYGATTNENQSRLINAAVTGLFLDGDDLTTASGWQAADANLTNNAINAVARVGQSFTPVEGNTGTAAANIFVRQDGATWCLAIFNYASGATNMLLDLNRAGLPTGDYTVTNLWDGTTLTAANSFNVSLNAKQAKLFRLAILPPMITPPKITGGNLIFSGSNGVPNGTYYVLVATNLNSWATIATNQFDANGNFAVTNGLSSSVPQQFYRIQFP
jgi:hypothetical protein